MASHANLSKQEDNTIKWMHQKLRQRRGDRPTAFGTSSVGSGMYDIERQPCYPRLANFDMSHVACPDIVNIRDSWPALNFDSWNWSKGGA
jgi:hypothetical protein